MFRVLVICGTFILAGCGPSGQDQVVGMENVRFGASRAQLAAYIEADQPGCSAQLRGHPESSLVFASDDRLVLVWFDAPLHTTAGVTTGATVDAVLRAYPKAAR